VAGHLWETLEGVLEAPGDPGGGGSGEVLFLSPLGSKKERVVKTPTDLVGGCV